MDTITRKAYAKINLGLDVVGKLPNGYHEVKMIMQNVNIYDILTFEKRPDDRIVITTNDSDLPLDENNLIYKAVLLLRELSGNRDGVSIHLEKNIPVAAGMAGGSSDAAGTLLGVNELLKLGFGKEFLMEQSVKIGADVPYCVLGKTALSEGIGEKLTEIDAPPRAHLVVAKPNINVSTPVVYKKLDEKECCEHPDIDGLMEALKNKDLKAMTDKMGNVLELVTIEEYPVITDIKNEMLKNGALGTLMSGSGPSVFGIFDGEKRAQNAISAIEKAGFAKQVFLTEFV